MKSFIISLLVLGVFGFSIYWLNGYRPQLGTMHPVFMLLIALSVSFVYVHSINPFKRIKPFNCVKCLTGWVALILGYLFGVQFYFAYLFIGVLAGGLFERLTLRYL